VDTQHNLVSLRPAQAHEEASHKKLHLISRETQKMNDMHTSEIVPSLLEVRLNGILRVYPTKE